MLVMIDGRTVYSPLFTGVFWNALDYLLDDLDRIEGIRGPGATLCGANGEFMLIDLQARWVRALSPRSQAQVQTYVNHEDRRIPAQLAHRLTTVDVELQHAFTAARHGVVWGGGVRSNRDTTEATPVLSFDPPSRTYPVSNLFAQDDITLYGDRLYLIGGIKVEHNAFSGAEWQPSLRTRVLLPRSQLLWAGGARAVRRPTRFSADATLYFHNDDRIRSQEAPRGAVPFPLVVGNTLNGTSRGLELGVNLQPADWWRIHASYTHLRVALSRDSDSRDVGGGSTEANDPDYLFALRTSFDLPHNVERDARLRSVGALPNPVVPAFTDLGLRTGWRATRHLELALVGDDLLHSHHPEFNPTGRGYEEFEHSVRATATVRF